MSALSSSNLKFTLACSQVVDVVVAAKHVSDAILEEHGIGPGRVTKTKRGARKRGWRPRYSDFHPSNMATEIQMTACKPAKFIPVWRINSPRTNFAVKVRPVLSWKR